jgi:hypothetical protein
LEIIVSKVFVDVALSMDGFIAGPNGGSTFHFVDDDIHTVLEKAKKEAGK